MSKTLIRPLVRCAGDAPCLAGMSKDKVMQITFNQRFSLIGIAPLDMVPTETPIF